MSVEIKNLYWKYEPKQSWILRNVNLSIDQGEFVAIVGPNGAGKTTLCLCMNGLIPHNFRQGTMEGNIRVSGINIQESSPRVLSRKVGVVFQDPEMQFLTANVEDEVAFVPENLGLEVHEINKRINWALEIVRMKDYVHKSPQELSGGQKQRIAIASVLAALPEILVLDEPTSQLDPVGKEEVFSILKELKEERNITIIIAEHLTEKLAEYADRLILLNNGEIKKDCEPREFFWDVEYLKQNGVYPPQVTEFAYFLSKNGFPIQKVPLTLKEGKIMLTEFLKNKPLHLEERFFHEKAVLETYRLTIDEEKPIIETNELQHVYPDGTIALKGVTTKIYPREFVAIIGQNGSGKTTLVKHFNGLLKPTKGTVLVKGLDTRKVSMGKLCSIVGYVFQNPDHQICQNSVLEEICFGARNLGISEEEIQRRSSEILKTMGLETVREEHPFFLSKGERQRVVIASILMMQPEILIVDEPTTGQDMKVSYEIMDLLKKLNEYGHTIIVITHNMRLVAEYTKRTIVMANGTITYDGPTYDVFSKSEILDKAFLAPPQITSLAQSFTRYGFSRNILTVEQMLNEFISVYSR
jgi:energy-coupling factor transport system ATP-binding protein